LSCDLNYPGGKVRLFVDADLARGTELQLSDSHAHYLLGVMRARIGSRVRLFNGRDGEWVAALREAGRKSAILSCEEQTGPQVDVPDIWLLFAPIKRTPADYVAQKATELGVRVLQPVLTRRTIVNRVNLDRLRANAIEAAEQSGRVNVPDVRLPLQLPALLAEWDSARLLIFCDEGREAKPIARALADRHRVPCAILTGPEGGFDPDERALLRGQPFVLPVALGARILRADTAALAALSVWQALRGDWEH
jgi:16S rRNA (uracil1498-N3)-methyltransferase